MPTFAEALFALPTERLKTLVQTRQVEPRRLALVPNKRQLAQFLSNEFSRPPSVVGAILQCNARELRLLQLMTAGQENSVVKWTEVVAAAGDASLAETLSTLLTRLEDLGLAFRIRDSVYVPDPVRAQIPASLSDRYTLARLLNAYDAMAVKRVYDELGFHSPGAKPANIEKIVAHLLHSEGGLQLNRSLDEEEMTVLEHLIAQGGAASPTEIARAALDDESDAFFRYDWQNRWKQGRATNAIDRLLERGLIYVVSQGYGFNLYLVIPGDLLRVLAGTGDTHFWTSPPPAPTPLPASPPSITTFPAPVRDVVSLLAFVGTQEAARTNTGTIHKTALKNIARTLRYTNERYATFLYAVCREAGLIAPQGDRQLYGITPKGQSWLQKEMLAQAQELTRAWSEGDLWGEMYNDPLRRENSYRPKDAVIRIRQAALRLIREHAGDTWLEIGSVADALAFQSPLLMVQSAAMGSDLTPSPAIFIRQLIGECLAWLGLVELGGPEAPLLAPEPAQATPTSGKGKSKATKGVDEKPPLPEPTGYRLTSLGKFLLDVPDAPEMAQEPREEAFIVQANAEIFVPPFLAPATLYRLLTITEAPTKGATGNTVTLTRDAIRRALDAGDTPRDLIAFLQAHSRTGIPQNVEYLINETGGKHGHIQIGKALMFLKTDSVLLMKELQARRELKELFLHDFGEVAILNAEDPEKLLRELRKAGYSPVNVDAQPRARLAEDSPAPVATNQAPVIVASRGATKETKRELKLETAVDWKRIAQDDDKSWKEVVAAASTIATPADAMAEATRIKVLINKAILHGEVVEIAISEQNADFPEILVIEPQYFMGNYVYAHSQTDSAQVSVPLKRILWARTI